MMVDLYILMNVDVILPEGDQDLAKVDGSDSAEDEVHHELTYDVMILLNDSKNFNRLKENNIIVGVMIIEDAT